MSTKQPPERGCDPAKTESLAKSQFVSTKGITHGTTNPTTPKKEHRAGHPADEVKLGIDLWHAVEFSRSGRTPTNHIPAAHRGNPSSLGHLVRRGQISRSDSVRSLCLA